MKALSSRPAQCLRAVPFTSRPCTSQRVVRPNTVKVFAKKNRTKSPEPIAFRNMAKNRQETGPSFPPVDPENAELIVYFRTEQTAWVPFNLISGKTSPQLNLLIKSCESQWGRALFQKTLIKGVAQTIYKERKSLEKSIRKGNPTVYGNVPGGAFIWGLKIRDRNDTARVPSTVGITVFPPEEEVQGTAVDTIQQFFSGAFGGSSSAPAMPAVSSSTDSAESKQA